MDNQNQQGEKRRGAVDYINSLRSINVTLRTVGQIVTKPFPWVWIVVIIILLIVLFQLFFGGGTGLSFDLDDSQDSNLPGSPGTGSIASCTFYRGGDFIPGVQMGNLEMAQFVNSVSAQVGVPAAVVAGIMRIESGGRFAQADPSYFASDYDAVSSGVAYGLMQFTPGTFIRTFQVNSAELNSIFGKTDVRSEIDPQNNMYSDSYLRIYSIRDSIIAATFKVKNDKQDINGDGPWDQNTIYEIARRYYGCLLYPSCSSGPYSYGEDVWNSVRYCRPSTGGPLAATDCPIDNGVITCGSLFTPINGPLGLCAHCGIGYNAPCNFLGTRYAIDIEGVDFTDVKLPKINNNIIRWIFSYQASRGPNEAIFGYAGEDPNTAGRYYLQLHHVAPGSQKTGTAYSGDIGAKICGNGCAKGHVHVQLGTGATSANTTTWADAAQFFCRAQI
ncbi:MAG: hypothetical protein HY427_03400 [Candidatus Levybacteria bacterium]|nr:hypothetical protein [Candidatus Levybacteria bacterium]